jgi:uncharacterized cupin superfamily protein
MNSVDSKYTSVQREWKQKGFSCDLWVDSPGQVWADFVHHTDELVMLVEGELELRMEGKIYRPKRGETLLIPAGVSHTVINIGNVTNRWLYGYKRL